MLLLSSRGAKRLVAVAVSAAVLLTFAAACARLEPRQSASSTSAGSTQGHDLEEPGLRTFMEQRLGHPLDEWPLRSWDFASLTMAGWYFHPTPNDAQRPAGEPDAMAIDTGAADQRPHRDEESSRLAAHAGGKAERLAKARRLAGSERWHKAMLAWRVFAGVRTNLVAYVAAQRRNDILHTLGALYEETIRVAQLRVALDAIGASQLAMLRVRLAETQLELTKARVDIMQTRDGLARALTLPASALLGVELKYDLSRRLRNDIDVAGVVAQALLGRPDMLEAVSEYAAAEAALRRALSKKHPDATLQGGGGWSPEKTRWIVAPDLGLPQDAGSAVPIGEAESLRTAAADRVLTLQSTIVDEVLVRASLYGLALEELAAIERLAATIQEQHDSLESGFKAGLSDALSLLLARLQLVHSELVMLDAELLLQSAVGSLEDVVLQPVELIGYSEDLRLGRM